MNNMQRFIGMWILILLRTFWVVFCYCLDGFHFSFLSKCSAQFQRIAHVCIYNVCAYAWCMNQRRDRHNSKMEVARTSGISLLKQTGGAHCATYHQPTLTTEPPATSEAPQLSPLHPPSLPEPANWVEPAHLGRVVINNALVPRGADPGEWLNLARADLCIPRCRCCALVTGRG